MVLKVERRRLSSNDARWVDDAVEVNPNIFNYAKI
jgi:hypothetical protein